MSHDAFVSYASSDRVVAYRMVDYLESCGIRCWVAPRDVPGGRNYAKAILDALNETELFLLIFSEASNASEHVQREVERALHLTKPIVPVRIRDLMPSGAMDYYLATLHWLDAFCTDSGDASDEDAEGVELGCQDVARAVGSLLGRESKVEKGIAAKQRARIEAEEQRNREAAEREARVRLETEARARAEIEAAAKAKAEIEAEDRRRLEAEERKRKADQERRERERERQREERERQEQLQREQEERELRRREERELEKRKRREAAASGAGESGASGLLIKMLGILTIVLLGVGWWAYERFTPDETGPSPLTLSPPLDTAPPAPAKAPPVVADVVAGIQATFSWADQQHSVSAIELLTLDTESSERLQMDGVNGDRLRVKISPNADAEGEDPGAEAILTLSIPGFSSINRRVVLDEGEQDVDFGTLVRRQGEVRISSAYADQTRAADAHGEWLKNVQLEWQGIAPSDLKGVELPSSVAQKVEEWQRAGSAVGDEIPALAEEEVSASVGSGVYAVWLETACQPPFDRVKIAQVEITAKSDSSDEVPGVVVPIVPIGVFGGTTQWTSTSTDSAQDDDGTVTWNLYNLPEVLDLSSDGPRMVQSYIDIIDEGTRQKTIYLPAPITEVHFDTDKGAWMLHSDPTEIVRKLVDDDLNDRYFEAIDFSLSHHADKRTLLFDAETVDQPLNATQGTLRSFPLSNAYAVFADAVEALDAAQPGFGVVDVKAVYDHVAAISDKKNAENYRRTLTMPFSSSKPLTVELGITPDRDYSGSGSMRIDAVVDGSPASVAGLKTGDLLVGIGGLKIGGVGDFYRVRFGLSVGSVVEAKVLRDGREIALAITPQAVGD